MPRRLPPEKQEVISADGVYELATRFAIVPERGSVDIVAQSRGNRLPVTVCVDVHSMPKLSAKYGPSAEHTTSCPAVVDTGATVTCCGPNVLAALGVQRADLLPSNIRLFAANKSRLQVWGILPVTLALTADGGHRQVTELLHIAWDLSGMYLSKDVLAALGSITPSFPYPPPSHPGTAFTAVDVHSVAGSPAASDGSQQAPCGCPLRTATPDPPQIPAGATEGDIPQVKELLLSHYASSTFNTCSHQPLPLMHGPPL